MEASESSVFQILSENFPDVFNFGGSTKGPEVVRSTAASLEIQNRSALPSKVSPGEVIALNFSAYDDFNQVVSTVKSSFALVSTDNALTSVSDDNFGVLRNDKLTELPFSMNGIENQNVTVIIFSTDVGSRVQTTFSLEVVLCGFGFTFNSDQNTCDCKL